METKSYHKENKEAKLGKRRAKLDARALQIMRDQLHEMKTV